MNEFNVNPFILKEKSHSFEDISKNMQTSTDQIQKISMQLKITMHSNITKSLNTVIEDLDNEAKSCKLLYDQLLQIATAYENHEQKICNEHKNTKNNNEDTSQKHNDNEDEISPDDMSYEEYLQYRYENAVDENTRKLYEKYMDNINIKDDDYEDGAFYNSFWNHIKYNAEDDAENVRGIGCTYYHETGHLIDDQSDWFGDTSTDGSYDFYEKLNEDVDNYINNIMEEKGYTDIEDAYSDFSNWLNEDGNMKNGISDLVNGITDGKACGGWSHADDYYNSKSIPNEAFAHFFEAGMAADPTKLDYIKEVFPSAYAEYQKMIEDELN